MKISKFSWLALVQTVFLPLLTAFQALIWEDSDVLIIQDENHSFTYPHVHIPYLCPILLSFRPHVIKLLFAFTNKAITLR
jgi:hypothetical protein